MFHKQFQYTLRQLKATWVNIEEQEIVYNLLIALQNCFDTVITLIKKMTAEPMTYENVKKKLLRKKRALKIKNSIIATNQAAFILFSDNVLSIQEIRTYEKKL